MIVYNKLVRDRIPEIIEADGKLVKTKVLDNDQYLSELNKKLGEEFREYEADHDLSELADMMEVIHAIVDANGVSRDDFEKKRLAKVEKNGAFKKRIYLESVEG